MTLVNRNWQSTSRREILRAKDETYADVFDGLSRSVVPESVIQPESDQFQRRLRAEHVLRRHVEVVHERQHLLPADRNVDTFRAFLHAALDDVLNVV